jgi:hypothetical protein
MGIFGLAILLLLVPFVALGDYFGKLGRLDPRSAALTKASHGAGMLALGLWAYWKRYSIGLTVFDWVPLAVLGVAAFGLFWLAAGWRAAKIYGPAPGVDEFLIARSVGRLAVGAVLWWLPGADQGPLAPLRLFVYSTTGYDLWAQVVDVNAGLLRFAASWCFITGLAKIVLLQAVKQRRPRNLPPLHPAPRGHAGNASRDEAFSALQRRGNRIDLDKRQF